MNGNRALVLFSGGLDSATCLYWAKAKFDSVSALSFNYWGRLAQEKRAFHSITERAGIKETITVDLPFLKEAADTLEETGSTKVGNDSRWSSYVPARNVIFYSIAAHFAERRGMRVMVGGHSLDDAEFFRDSSPEFMEKLGALLERGCLTCDGVPIRIILPFAAMRRGDIVRMAVHLGVPVELTWSCHNEGEFHCGQCFACRQRAQAFCSLGMFDPAFRTPHNAR